jgi:hypothetical protein
VPWTPPPKSTGSPSWPLTRCPWTSRGLPARAVEHTFAERFGEQIESNWDKLRGKKPNQHGPHQLSGTPSLRLGAGRSLVQIRPPRLTNLLQMGAFVAQSTPLFVFLKDANKRRPEPQQSLGMRGAFEQHRRRAVAHPRRPARCGRRHTGRSTRSGSCSSRRRRGSCHVWRSDALAASRHTVG